MRRVVPSGFLSMAIATIVAAGLVMDAVPPSAQAAGAASTAMPCIAKVGDPPGQNDFLLPGGVATDGKFVYVADTNNYRIVKRKVSDLTFVAQVGGVGSGNDQFLMPSGVAVSGSVILVADAYNNRVVKRAAS